MQDFFHFEQHINQGFYNSEEQFFQAFEDGLKNKMLSMGWVLRIGIMQGLAGKEAFRALYKMIASIPGQKAGWALDRAIFEGWMTQDEFIEQFSIISPIPGQKAGWALDHAVTMKVINPDNLLPLLEDISGIEGQKICFPLHHSLELGLLSHDRLLYFLDKNYSVQDQGVGWTIRQAIRLGVISREEAVLYTRKIASIPGQKAGWALDQIIKVGWIKDQSLFYSFFNLTSQIPRQHSGWAVISAFKHGIISLSQTKECYHTISNTNGQHAGWLLRWLLKSNFIPSKEEFQGLLVAMRNTTEQEERWSIDIAFEKSLLSDEQIIDFYKFPYTIKGYNSNWFIYNIISQNKAYLLNHPEIRTRYRNVALDKTLMLILLREQELEKDMSILERDDNILVDSNMGFLAINIHMKVGFRDKEQIIIFCRRYLSLENQKIGFFLRYLFTIRALDVGDILQLIKSSKPCKHQHLGAILSELKGLDPEFLDTREMILKYASTEGQSLGIALAELIARGIIDDKEDAKSQFSIFSKVSGQAGEHFLDISSELGWLNKKEYQRFFTVYEI